MLLKWPLFTYRMFQLIIDDKSEPLNGEEKLAALTAGERVPWAKARKSYFATGVNRASLSAIERGAFVLVLDENEYNYCPVSLWGLEEGEGVMSVVCAHPLG